MRNGKKQLPIQEDETALVIWLVARHYERTRDLDFLRSVYRRLVVQPADFMVAFRDPETHLPLPTSTSGRSGTASSRSPAPRSSPALEAASTIANLFNEPSGAIATPPAAQEIRDATLQHLFLPDAKQFARGLISKENGLELDRSIDASTFGTFYLGAFPPGTRRSSRPCSAVREKLAVRTEVGGVARYAGDAYHRISEETERVPGNPWLICSLWLAEYAIATRHAHRGSAVGARSRSWVRSKALPSLILPEQIDPYDGRR